MTVQKLFLTLSMAAAIPAAFAQTGTTTTTATRAFQFQPIGLGSTETAQINVYNSAADSKSGTASSCTGTITFLNGTGATIGTATTFTVTANQVSSATLPFSSSGGTGARTIIIGSVSSTFTSGTPCNLSVTLETFDTTTGATHVELAGGTLIGGHGVSPLGH